MSGLVGVAGAVTAAMVVVAVALTVTRMLRGPGTADRAVALDLLGMIAVSGCGLLALGIGNIALLDIGLGLGLVGFISAIAVAGLMARAPQREVRERETDTAAAGNPALAPPDASAMPPRTIAAAPPRTNSAAPPRTNSAAPPREETSR